METFEQKYNAALTWMRNIYPSLTGANKEDAEHYFPELKESEDEKMRKAALEGIEYLERKLGWDFIGDTDILDVKEYLEKRKEQKPIFKKGDKVIWQDEEFNILDVNGDSYNVGGYILPFSREGELRPVRQKPAEWSKEDEKMLNGIIERGNSEIPKRECGLTPNQVAWLEERLKSLRPQPKKELSIEKAIQWLDDTFCFLDNSSGRGRDYEITTHDFDSLEEMYDSFRKAVTVDSQPHWKPSEEQMEWLESAVKLSTDKPHIHGIIISLYEQLKRL